MNRINGLIDCAMNQATNCMLDEGAKGVWSAWDVGKTLKAEIQDEIRVSNIVAITQFVDSLKEWCETEHGQDTNHGVWSSYNQGSIYQADDLLKFAVQRLELIKEGK